MATMITACPVATPLTVAHLAWRGEGVVLEEGTVVTGVEPLTHSAQHSQWPLLAMKRKVGYSFLISLYLMIMSVILRDSGPDINVQ